MHSQVEPVGETPEAALCRRARKHRARGDQRRAMLALREAAHANTQDARLWTLYGAQCGRNGKLEAARQAFGHAVWLRERDRDDRRAAITRTLIDRLDEQHRAA